MISALSKLKLWQRDLGALAVLNVLTLTHAPVVGDFAWIILITFFPGVLLMRVLGYEPDRFWLRVVHTIALSVSFLMLGGLLINVMLPLFGVAQPLLPTSVLFSLDTGLGLLIVLNSVLGRTRPLFDWEALSLPDAMKHIGFLMLPGMALVGATILNNGGSSAPAVLTVCAVTGALFYAVIRVDTLRESLTLMIVYAASLALLFMMSMRSWHVIGYDVNQELFVFQITQNAFYWSMSHFQDAYNACLSITILPVIYSTFLNIPDEYVYKFVFQLLFALLPVTIFYVFRKFGEVHTALLAVVMLVGQAIFSHAMPALIRQEFGFLFFALVLLTVFSTNIGKSTRYTLLAVYGISILISHYSTTYIAIMLLGATYAGNRLLIIGKRRC